jgi:hypothetical protein
MATNISSTSQTKETEMQHGTHERESAVSVLQINMLTNYLKNYTEEYAEDLRATILGRPLSYYGYILVPGCIADADVVNILRCDDPDDSNFTQLMAKLELDFAWYDDCGRHVMVWGHSQAVVDAALGAIRLWIVLHGCN